DRMREHCPACCSPSDHCSVFRLAVYSRNLADHHSFFYCTSRHLTAPNEMDPPEYTAFYGLIEGYFSVSRMAAFEPVCREIAEDLALSALAQPRTELIASFAQPFALRIQCAFMGWPPSLQEPLQSWATRNNRATLRQDRQALAALAAEFEALIGNLLAERRASTDPEHDLTCALMQEQV